MKRLTFLMLMMFCLSCTTLFTVGCGDGKSTEQAPEAELEDEGNLEDDMAAQGEMAKEGADEGGSDPAAP